MVFVVTKTKRLIKQSKYFCVNDGACNDHNADFSLNPLATLCLIIQRILAGEHVKFGLLKFKILS